MLQKLWDFIRSAKKREEPKGLLRDQALRATKLGLSLSGGGFRAAAFHLGVFDTLKDMGILPRVKVLSAVSGGSIIGARYCLKHEESYENFRESMYTLLQKTTLVGNFDIFINTLARFPIPAFDGLTRQLKSGYNKHLYHSLTLNALAESKPYLMINTTNLVTGNIWVFARDLMGDLSGPDDSGWSGRARRSGDYEVAEAVAASSAFPGVFAPIKFPGILIGDAKYLALADGGIVDNQGVTALLAQGCDFLIVSDASKPFDVDPAPPISVIGLVVKALELAGNQLRETRVSAAKVRGCALIELSARVPGEPEELVNFVASTGTHLRKLGGPELNTLIGHGSQVTQGVLNQRAV